MNERQIEKALQTFAGETNISSHSVTYCDHPTRPDIGVVSDYSFCWLVNRDQLVEWLAGEDIDNFEYDSDKDYSDDWCRFCDEVPEVRDLAAEVELYINLGWSVHDSQLSSDDTETIDEAISNGQTVTVTNNIVTIIG